MTKTRIAAAVAALALLLNACTTSTAHRPTSTGHASSDASAASSPTAKPGEATTSDAPDPRLAVQQAWAKFWSVYVGMHRLPAAQVGPAIAAVAVTPTLQLMKTELTLFAETHLDNYGHVVNHVYETTVKSPTTAVVKDCMDQSQFGSLYTTTGKKRTVGVARDDTTASLVKGSDGTWRVQRLAVLLDVKC